jgi:hypothetical protein
MLFIPSRQRAGRAPRGACSGPVPGRALERLEDNIGAARVELTPATWPRSRPSPRPSTYTEPVTPST